MRVAILTASDTSQYRNIMLQAYEQEADAFTSTAEERAHEPESWWLKRIADPQGMSTAFGAFNDEEIVGTVTLEYSSRHKTKHKVHVIGMYVSPSQRGCGVGKLLLEAAIRHAQALEGTLTLTLTVTEGNEAAINLYKAAGFQIFGTEPMAIRTEDGFKAKVHMWRSIASMDTAP